MPTAAPTLTPAPTSPDRADRATFAARAVALDDWTKNNQVPEMQALGANVYANAVGAAADAATAAANAALTDADAVQTAADRVQTTADRIIVQSIAATAGVASVNGMTGAVTGVATQAGAETLTNKTLAGATNNIEASSLKSATTTVVVSAATAPTAGQVLTATSDTAANWQAADGGTGTGTLTDVNASRSLATTYTNSGSTTRWVVVTAQASAAGLLDLIATVGAAEKARQNITATGAVSHIVSVIVPVPASSTYAISCGNGTVRNWHEFQ